jgi:DNA repair protein RadA/Sms
MEGRRALVTEVQALVAETTMANPRRATSGLDGARVAMLIAVLQRRAGIGLHNQEVYAATVGGVRLAEPASDLALALAIAGAARDQAVIPGLAAIGEVGLAGEVRPVSAHRARIAEAARLGIAAALVPAGADLRSVPLRTIEVANVTDALQRGLAPKSQRAFSVDS